MALDKTERRLQIGVLGYRFPRSRSCFVPAADPRKPSLNSMFEFH